MEVWKDIEGYEGYYQVSNLGRVKSFKCNSPKILKNGKCTMGYYMVSLNNSSRRIHRLVAETFIQNPSNKKTVNHKNGVKGDNHVDNLEWATQKENVIHSLRTGLKKTKLTEEDVLEIRRKYIPISYSMGVLSKEYNVSKLSIFSIIHRNGWTHI